jgi:hypothetical protein
MIYISTNCNSQERFIRSYSLPNVILFLLKKINLADIPSFTHENIIKIYIPKIVGFIVLFWKSLFYLFCLWLVYRALLYYFRIYVTNKGELYYSKKGPIRLFICHLCIYPLPVVLYHYAENFYMGLWGLFLAWAFLMF